MPMHRSSRPTILLLALAAWLPACLSPGPGSHPAADAGPRPGKDSGEPPGLDASNTMPDARVDAGSASDAAPEADLPDTATADAGAPDMGVPDGGPPDTGAGDPCAGAEDGVPCDDGDPCTVRSVCTAGVCGGGVPRAKYEPPDGRVAHAMGQWPDGNAAYITALADPALLPTAQLIFVDLGDTPRGWSPANLERSFTQIESEGRLVHIDLALRGLQPTPAELAGMEDPLYGIDDEIANGTGARFLDRARDVARIVRNHGRPVFVRIGGEFSGAWNGYHPYAYPVAYRRVVEAFREEGAENAAFIWCYEPAAADDFDVVDEAGSRWWPGDDVIDWYGIDLFAEADIAGPESRNGRRTSYGRTLRFLAMARDHRRPVVIAESSPSRVDITADPADGEADWQAWFVPYFALIEAHPHIKMFTYINFDWSSAGYYAQSGWRNADISRNATIVEHYLEELRRPRYLHRPELALLEEVAEECRPDPCGDGVCSPGESCAACPQDCQGCGAASVTFTLGPEEVVFDWTTDRCEDMDLPDVYAHALRTPDGIVLASGNAPSNYWSFGADLDGVRRSCTPVLVSRDDHDPSTFSGQEWITSIWTADGIHVYALVHDEYHDPVAPNCRPGDSSPANPCWYNAITWAASDDGGRSFHRPEPNGHLVAAPPSPWNPDAVPRGAPPPYGYMEPSNVVPGPDGAWYALFFALTDPARGEVAGTCLMRTEDPSRPDSWRLWDGAAFSIPPTDPYIEEDPAPPCAFLRGAGGLRGSLTWNSYLGRYLLVGSLQTQEAGQTVCGIGYSTSADLLVWEQPRLLRRTSLPWEACSVRGLPVDVYPSLIDPDDTSLDFHRTGQTPWLYFTRFNGMGLDRDLLRVRLRLDAGP